MKEIDKVAAETRARQYTLVLANITYKDGYEAVDQLYGSVMWSIEHDGVERSYPTSDAVASLYSAGQYAEVERLRAAGDAMAEAVQEYGFQMDAYKDSDLDILYKAIKAWAKTKEGK